MAVEGKGSACKAHGQQRSVTIAVDESERSMEAVSWAAKNLVHAGDAVTLLHVQDKPDLAGGLLPTKETPLTEDAIESIRTHVSTMSRRTLQRAKERCQAHQIDAEAVTVIGDARDLICKYVGDHHTDLLVVGSRGYGPLKRICMYLIAAKLMFARHGT